MDKLKQWIALTVVGVLGIMAVGWFVLTSPKNAEATELQDQAAAQEATNSTTRNEIKALREQAKDLPKARARLAAASVKIPSNPALPGLIRALTKAADAAGVEFVSLAPGAPVAATVQPAAAPAAPVAGATTSTTAVSPVTPVAATNRTLQSIPVVINVVGSYFAVQNYLSNLESLPRATRVTNLTVAPGVAPGEDAAAGAEKDGSSLLTVITGSVYMSSPAAPAVAPVSAAGSATTVAGAAPATK